MNMSDDTADGKQAPGSGEGSCSAMDQMRRDLEVEFNVQRAKMKDLFLQKEEDLRKMHDEKQQLESEVLQLREELLQLHTLSHNQSSEIDSLQLLVNETVEASSSGSAEMRRLRGYTQHLEQQLHALKQQLQDASLAPATLVRSLARKLGADTDDPPAKKTSEDGEQDSIINPLKQEITALKEKLRDTDTQLQEALKSNRAPADPAPAGVSSAGDAKGDQEGRQCSMCLNYERQLVDEQAQAEAAREKARCKEHALRMATEELEGVRSLHDETVRTWQAERGAAADALDTLQAALAAAAERGAAAEAEAREAAQRALRAVTALTVTRETLQGKLDSLEKDNEMLVGAYLKTAEEMQNELIDLPDNVAELQELCLQQRERLVCACVGRERAIAADCAARAALQEQAAAALRQDGELQRARAQLAAATQELDMLQTEREQMQELGNKLRSSNDMIETLLEDKKRLQTSVMELRSRVSSLQTELDNSEKVQQDFVRLSQSLQVQLQRLREADTEVRWQHDDDVSECPECRAPLNQPKKKIHCRHCGRIFCGNCVSCTVESGPRRMPARVCRLCRTLLTPHAAPYFSTEAPKQPD